MAAQLEGWDMLVPGSGSPQQLLPRRPIEFSAERCVKAMTRGSTLICALALVSWVLSGCANSPTGAPKIAAEFQGVWVTADPRYVNWWEIHAERVINYGVTSDGTRCGAHIARILSADAIESSYGVIDKVRLKIVNKNLHFEGAKVLATYQRAGLNEICRRFDGSYFKDAPFASSR